MLSLSSLSIFPHSHSIYQVWGKMYVIYLGPTDVLVPTQILVTWREWVRCTAGNLSAWQFTTPVFCVDMKQIYFPLVWYFFLHSSECWLITWVVYLKDCYGKINRPIMSFDPCLSVADFKYAYKIQYYLTTKITTQIISFVDEHGKLNAKPYK